MTAMVSENAPPEPHSAAVANVRTITVRPAPRREPPFDDERDDRTVHSLLVQPRADPTLPFAPWPTQHTGPRSWSAPRRLDRGQVPDPQLWARRMVIALLEVRSGRRPVRQLAPHVTASVLAGLAEAQQRSDWVPQPPGSLRTLRSCEPTDGVAEIAAVIATGGRCHAIAARLEYREGHWRCVRLQLG